MSSSLNLLLYMLSTICVQHSVSLRQYHVITHLKTLSFFTVIVLNVREQFSYICIWSRNIKVSRVPLKLTPGWLDYELVGWLAFNILSWWLLLFLSLSVSLSLSFLLLFLFHCLFWYLDAHWKAYLDSFRSSDWEKGKLAQRLRSS